MKLIIHNKLQNIITGIKGFNKSYKLFLYDYTQLFIFPFLLILLYLVTTITGIQKHILDPLISEGFLLEALTFNFSYNQHFYILIMVFAYFVQSLILISFNIGLSTYTLQLLNKKEYNVIYYIYFGFKKAFTILPWVLVFTIMYILLQKIGGHYSYSSLLFITYTLIYIFLIMLVTLVNLNLILKNDSLFIALQKAFKILKLNIFNFLGIAFYLIFLASFALIGNILSWAAIAYPSLHALSIIFSLPLYFAIVIFFIIVWFSFSASTILGVKLYMDTEL